MNIARKLAAIVICLTTVTTAADEYEEPDLTVTQPLSAAEQSAAAKLTRLPSARMWWNDDNRIVGVSLKGTDANDRAVALSSQLPGLRALVLVAFPQNDLSDNCLAPLAGHPSLRLLSISGNRPGDNALVHIQTISTLEVLILNGDFTDAAVEVVSSLPKLTHLDLTQCHVTDAGVIHLPKLDNLKTLILNGTDISNESLQAITQLKRLSELYLGDTALDDGAIEQLKTLDQLELLFIKGTGITADGLASLAAALPSSCRIIHDSGTVTGKSEPRIATLASGEWRSSD